MKRIVPLFASAALAFAIQPAQAADYDAPIFVEKMPSYVPVEIGTGWYLRGDITYNIGSPTYPGLGVENLRIGGGGGFGYQFTDFFRVDATVAFVARDRFAEAGDSLSHSLWAGLINGYVDLGTFVGITPYVGAGIGLAHARDSIDVPALTASRNQNRLAYALNAGAAYRMTDNVSLDVGYQFLHAPNLRYWDVDTGVDRNNVAHHQLRVGLRYELW